MFMHSARGRYKCNSVIVICNAKDLGRVCSLQVVLLNKRRLELYVCVT
jgi:hypothetical protein